MTYPDIDPHGYARRATDPEPTTCPCGRRLVNTFVCTYCRREPGGCHCERLTDEPPAAPVAPVVARLRLPLAVTGLETLADALEAFYGPGCVMLADGSKEWLTVLGPTP